MRDPSSLFSPMFRTLGLVILIKPVKRNAASSRLFVGPTNDAPSPASQFVIGVRSLPRYTKPRAVKVPVAVPKRLICSSTRLVGLVVPSVAIDIGGRFQYSPRIFPPAADRGPLAARLVGTSIPTTARPAIVV